MKIFEICLKRTEVELELDYDVELKIEINPKLKMIVKVLEDIRDKFKTQIEANE